MEVLVEDIAGPIPSGRERCDALWGTPEVPPGLYGDCGKGPRSISVAMFALALPLSKKMPESGVSKSWLILGLSVAIASSSVAFPFPLSSLGSPLFLRDVSMLTLLGSEILFDWALPLLSTCRLALVDAECRFCLCSGNVNRG